MIARERCNEHLERIKFLNNGGRLECPYCRKGFVSRVSEGTYICDKCGKGMITRIKIDLPA